VNKGWRKGGRDDEGKEREGRRKGGMDGDGDEESGSWEKFKTVRTVRTSSEGVFDGHRLYLEPHDPVTVRLYRMILEDNVNVIMKIIIFRIIFYLISDRETHILGQFFSPDIYD
jgi:hypothetical protein